MADPPVPESPPSPPPPPGGPGALTERVADADRDRTVTQLRENVVEGRLTLDEFSERVGSALQATTRGDLLAVMADLPQTRPTAETLPERSTSSRKKRRWHVAVLSGHSTKGRWRISGKTNAVAVMGGCDMDLRRAEIEGPEVEITAVAFWGGIDIIVPEGFDVELRGFSFMGGRELKLRDVPIVPGSPRIVVRGFAVMGGIDVKSRPNRSGKRLARASATDEIPTAVDPLTDPTQLAALEQDIRRDLPRDGTVTILFCDMVDYSGMTERLGDQASRASCSSTIASCVTPSPATVAARSACRGTGSWWRSVARPAPCVAPSTFSAPASPTFPPTTASPSRCTSASTPVTPSTRVTTTSGTRSSWRAGWPTPPARARSWCRPCPSNSCKGRASSRSTACARRASREWRARRCRPPLSGRGERVNQEEAWRDAGLYDSQEPGAAERLALLEYLTERGATIVQMVSAHRMGTLPGVAGDLVTQGRTAMVSVDDVAARTGLPSSRVMRALLAAGIPARSGTEVPADLVSFMAAFEQGAALLGEEAILAFTRVLGAAANNVAEAAVALFFAELGPGTVREGPDELARARLAEAATTAFTAVPDVLALLVLDAFERAQRRAEAARSWLGSSPPADDEPEGPSEVVALGFVDLVGSTAWAQTLSLRDQSLALSRFESAAWTSAVLAGGRVVKTIGDEVFFAAPTAEAACRIALEVCRAAAGDEVLPPARGAVGIGLATPREGDYFGPLVNLLSRLVKAGAPGEVVVTEAAAADLPAEGWVLRPLEPAALRGIDEPVRVFTVQIPSGA